MVYFMSRLLNAAHRSGMPNPLLYSMEAKITQRLVKLGEAGTAVRPVLDALEHSDQTLRDRWLAVQQRDIASLNLDALASLKFSQDVDMSLPALDSYIEAMDSRQRAQGDAFHPKTTLMCFDPEHLPKLSSRMAGEYAVQNLQRFEAWVVDNLAA